MKTVAMLMVLVIALFAFCSVAQAEIRYISPYSRSDGTYVSGHYKDVSGDGNPYNNANYLGLND